MRDKRPKINEDSDNYGYNDSNADPYLMNNDDVVEYRKKRSKPKTKIKRKISKNLKRK